MKIERVCKTETTGQEPLSISSETFGVSNHVYKIFRYPMKKGPNLEQTKSMAKSNEGWEMLTVEDAREIIDNAEANAAFRKALRLEEWGYIRDPEAEKMSRAAYLVNWHHEKLITEIAERPIVAAKIVILKQKAMLRR